MFGRAFCTPDDTGGGTGGIETGMRAVTFVGSTELTMGLGAEFWQLVSVQVQESCSIA